MENDKRVPGVYKSVRSGFETEHKYGTETKGTIRAG